MPEANKSLALLVTIDVAIFSNIWKPTGLIEPAMSYVPRRIEQLAKVRIDEVLSALFNRNLIILFIYADLGKKFFSRVGCRVPSLGHYNRRTRE